MKIIMKKGIIYVVALFLCLTMMQLPIDKVRAEETSAEPEITNNTEASTLEKEGNNSELNAIDTNNEVEQETEESEFIDGKTQIGSTESSMIDIVTIKFFDGDIEISDKQEIEMNGYISEPTNPQKAGYTFEGWFMEKEFKNQCDFKQAVTQDTSLYAKWRVNLVKGRSLRSISGSLNIAEPTLTGYPKAASSTAVLSNWENELQGDTYVLKKYIGSDSDVVIPSTIDGKKVAIDVGMDKSKYPNFFPTTITSITIEDSGNKVSLIQDSLREVFRGKYSMTSLDLSNLDTSNIVDMNSALSSNTNLKTIDVTGWDTSNVEDMQIMFFGNVKLTEIKGMNFDTSQVTTMDSMFRNCAVLTTINVNSFDTSNVTTFNEMFNGCKLLTSLDVSKFNTLKVTTTAGMFEGCKSLKSLDVSKFDTSSVTTMSRMFQECELLEVIDVSLFDTQNVTQLSNMFAGCTKVKELDVSGFKTDKVLEISSMFASCESLEEVDISGFTTVAIGGATERVRSIAHMFYGCKLLKKVDFASFNSTAILSIQEAFENCPSIQLFDFEKFSTPNLNNSYSFMKDPFTINDPDITEKVPTIIINPNDKFVAYDTEIPGRTYGGPNYDANGGELTPGVETARYFDHFVFANKNEFSVIKKVVAEKYTPTKTGVKFTGWYTDEACTLPFQKDTTLVDLTSNEYMNLTLYAGWANTVTFDSQGGSPVASKDIIVGDLITKPTDPTKGDATFMAWYKEDTLTTPWDFATDTLTSNITLYAAWGYDVKFVLDNGSSDNVVVVKDNSLVEKPIDPIKEGYTFAGWYKEDTLTTAWNFDTDKISGDKSIYAKWKIKTYTVNFENTTITEQTINHGDTVVKPTDPTKVGYTFVDWYKEDTFITPWNFVTDKISGDTTLYAKWSVNQYDVTFEENGGSAPTDLNLDYNSKITEPTSVTKTGYTLDGWYIDSACTNQWNFATDKISGDTTLYAKWSINQYDVTFEENGGSKQTDLNLDYMSKVSEPTSITRTGYTFAGWYKEAALTTPWNFATDKISGNTTLYAKWNANEYKVKYNTDKGVLSSSDKNVTYDQKYGTLVEPTNADAIFGGWYTEQYGKGIKRNESDIVKVQEDETLYAFWLNDFYEEEKGNIQFDKGQDDRYSLKVKEEDKEIVQIKDHLQSVYDIYFLLNDNRISMNNTKMIITLKLKEEEQGFKYYKVAYINSKGEVVEEYVPVLSTSKDEISFEVNHLSYYAVYAWNETKTEDIDQIKPEPTKPETKNPKTGDSTNTNAFIYLTMISGIFIVVGSKKKSKKQK